jgi:hypothetical protein
VPCAAPKPLPAMVTVVPGTPLAGVTEEMVAVFTVKGTALDQTPPCCTMAFPDTALDATRGHHETSSAVTITCRCTDRA